LIIIKCSSDREIHITADRLDHIRLDGLEAHRAILAGQDLTVSSLFGANMNGTRLNEAKLSGALYDDSTRWPEGFEPSEFGAIKIGAKHK